jgi:hypothetical protein
MATSGTSTFNLDIVELIEEAYEQAGLELRTGYELKTARRSLNLLALDWANRGYNLWTIEQGTFPLVRSVEQYELPADTIDIIEAVIRTSVSGVNTDFVLARISAVSYATIPVKTTLGRPVQLWVNRQITPRIVVWPVPQNNDYTFVYWRMRRIQDSGNSGELTFDIPERFLPCLVSGLAYKLAFKRTEAKDRLEVLKMEYEELWQNAIAEDREKAPVRIYPEIARI